MSLYDGKTIVDYTGEVNLSVSDDGVFDDLELLDMGETLGMQVFDWLTKARSGRVQGRLHILVELLEDGKEGGPVGYQAEGDTIG